MTGDVLLTARGLGRTVDGRRLWQGLELELMAGERLAVSGPSGTGKTLLLRSLAGLEPLEQGAVSFLGRDLASWRMPEYRRRVLLLPQRPALPEGTVEAALAAPFAFHVHRARSYRREAALARLAHVGREADFLGRSTATLSGGEAQVAALLRALLLEPQVLLLDEPTASLDAAATEAVEALVAAWLQDADDRAYLWTSHDPEQQARVSSRALRLGSA